MGNPRRIRVRALRELAEAWEQAVRRHVTSHGDTVAAVRIREPLKSSMGSPTLIALTAALSRTEGWEQDADGVFRCELTGGYIAFDPASCELEIVAELAADVLAEGEARTTVSGSVEDDLEAEGVGRYYDDGWGGHTESTGRQDAATNADRELAQARAERLARARAEAEAGAAGTDQARAEEAAQAALSEATAARMAELERQAVQQLTAVGEQGRAMFQQVVALAYRDAMLAYARSSHARGVRVSDSGGVLDIEFRTADPRYREPGVGVRINFRYRPDTGEVERFEVDDLYAGPLISDNDARLDRAATEVARIVESNARIEEVLQPGTPLLPLERGLASLADVVARTPAERPRDQEAPDWGEQATEHPAHERATDRQFVRSHGSAAHGAEPAAGSEDADDEEDLDLPAVSFTVLQEQLHSVLGTLSEREARVISMRFGLADGQPKTVDEVGKVYGVTRERIRQIESKAMSKLRQPSHARIPGPERTDAAQPWTPVDQPESERRAGGTTPDHSVAAARGDAAAWVIHGDVSPTARPGGQPAGSLGTGAVKPGLISAGKPGRPERFLVARLPARVPQSADVSLLVRVTASAPAPREAASVGLPGLEVGAGGARVTIVVQAPHDLVPLGDLEQVIVVPEAGDSQPVRFAFGALGSGLQRVLVTAWAGGTFLAELALEVSVQQSTPYVDGLERVAPVGTLRAEPGEVTLQVRFDGKQYTFQLLSGEYLFDPVVAEAVTAQPGEPLERMIATLRAMAAGSGGGYSAANARKWMERAGMGLWNDMVPDLIKEQFWRLRGSVSAFSIAVGRDVMPWELLYPLAQGCDEGFLVEQFPVMRRVYGQQRSHCIIAGNAMYVMPEGSPANALDEIAAIRRILGQGDVGAQAIGDLDVLLELIESGHMGLLHFACHNTFAADSGGSAIGMGGGPFVPLLLKKAVTLQALAGRHPLVFINACRTAGAVPEYTQMMGWAEQFMAAGAGAFVGTLWAVRSDSATKFAEAFYSALTDGAALGQAGQIARLEVARDRSDPTWLAYSVYGDPGAEAVTS